MNDNYVQEHIPINFYGEPYDHGWLPHKRDTWDYRYAQLREEIVFEKYLGVWENGSPLYKSTVVPKDTKVKIVMVSRMGDVGITTKLDAEVGYGTRVLLEQLHNYTKE